MDAGLIARRYATVLLGYATDHNVLDDVFADANIVRHAIAQLPNAQKFFDSPLHKPSEKKELLAQTFSGKVTNETLNFLTFLVDKDRISLVQQILLVFETLVKRQKNICTATITTARTLPDAQKQQIVESIQNKLRAAGNDVKAVDATFKTNPNIIGGLILEVDGRQADNSVASKLQQIEKQLTV